MEPGLNQCWPVGDWKGGRPQAVAVMALRVDVKFGGDMGGFELKEPGGGVFDVDGIVLGLEEEGGWSLTRGVQVGVVVTADARFLVRARHGG